MPRLRQVLLGGAGGLGCGLGVAAAPVAAGFDAGLVAGPACPPLALVGRDLGFGTSIGDEMNSGPDRDSGPVLPPKVNGAGSCSGTDSQAAFFDFGFRNIQPATAQPNRTIPINTTIVIVSLDFGASGLVADVSFCLVAADFSAAASGFSTSATGATDCERGKSSAALPASWRMSRYKALNLANRSSGMFLETEAVVTSSVRQRSNSFCLSFGGRSRAYRCRDCAPLNRASRNVSATVGSVLNDFDLCSLKPICPQPHAPILSLPRMALSSFFAESA